MKDYDDISIHDRFIRFETMIKQINESGINFLGLDSRKSTLIFEKDGKRFHHSLMTWQCAIDPSRPGITEDMVIECVINAFEIV